MTVKKDMKQVAKLTKQEKEDWANLCEYFKSDILEYTDKKIPRYAILRLKGLAEGKFMANKSQTTVATYTFKEILMTLKLSKSAIFKYFMNNNGSFTNEQHKINGIFVIIESEINNVKDILHRGQVAKEKMEHMDIEHHLTDSVKYKSTNKGINLKLKELL